MKILTLLLVGVLTGCASTEALHKEAWMHFSCNTIPTPDAVIDLKPSFPSYPMDTSSYIAYDISYQAYRAQTEAYIDEVGQWGECALSAVATITKRDANASIKAFNDALTNKTFRDSKLDIFNRSPSFREEYKCSSFNNFSSLWVGQSPAKTTFVSKPQPPECVNSVYTKNEYAKYCKADVEYYVTQLQKWNICMQSTIVDEVKDSREAAVENFNRKVQ